MDKAIPCDDVNVLFISKNENDADEITKAMLETGGMSCKVWYCCSLITAVDFFNKDPKKINVILLDMFFGHPDKTMEVFQHLQQLTGNIPIIIFTDPGHHQIAIEALKAGASDFLIKEGASIAPTRIRDCIESAMARDEFVKGLEVTNTLRLQHINERNAEMVSGLTGELSTLKASALETSLSMQHLLDVEEEAHLVAITEVEDRLEKTEKKLEDIKREKDQIISWMDGTYTKG